MKIVKIKISDIIPYENNVKLHPQRQIEQIKTSIQEFGNNDPIAVDENNVIIEGHGRYIALKELGYEDAECIVLSNLTEEQKNAYRLVHNKLTMNSGFDLDMLKLELEKIDFDMAQFDFEIDELKFDDEIEEDDFDIDSNLNQETNVKLGDIYKLDNHYLMCGDATSKSDIDKLIRDNKVDLVFTDPPYGINIVGDNGKVGSDNLAKNKIYSKVIADDTTETAEKSYKLLKNVCDKLIIWGGNYFLSFLEPSDGFLIWDKRVDMNSNNFADGEMAYCSFHTPLRIYHQLWAGMIREGEREERVHPTQKPVRTLSDILKDFSKENDIVLDVFGGSGSTLIACEQTNRKCLMMELDPVYVDIIIKRFENLTGKKAEKIN